MNKTLLILTCWLLGLVPCMAQQRTITDVQHLADSILNRPTRWGKRAKAVKTHRIIAASELLNCKQDAFYVCEAGTDGYAIISSDERMTPVLGFSQSKGFDADNIPAGLKELLDDYTCEYEALTSGKPVRLARRKIEDVQEQVGPLLITQWGQDTPFNNRCPEWEGKRCITGCVAISTAQTLCYYQYPDSAIGNVDYVTKTNQIPIQENLSFFKFNWPDIRSTYKNGATEREREAVADLVYACAVAVNMDFGLKESSANSQYQVNALVNNFGYDPDIASIHKDYMTSNEWQTLMVNELNNKRPIIYAANSPTLGGHSFIIDGYKADEDGYPFYHVNWGWEGFCDDYYKLSALEAGNYDYILNHEAIIYVQPDNKKQDAEYFWQANEVIVSTGGGLLSTRINPDVTHNFTVTLKNVFNYSYKTFTGKMEIYLKDEQEKEILVGSTQRLYNVPFSYGMTSITVTATLPNDIEEGNYILVIKSKADGSNKTEAVTYPSPLPLTVTRLTESYTPNVMITELLNVGEDLEDLSVSLTASMPMNFATKAFTGTLRMAVADDEGNILTQIGDVANLTNMGQFSYSPYAYTFKGKLPDYLEDGKYRLYLSANQSGYLEWGKVTGYKTENGNITSYGNELHIPFWLEDGKIIYHKAGEEELPEFYANIQVTDMQVTAFDPATRRIDMQITNLINMGSESFVGQFSMAIYSETDRLISPFGDIQKWSIPIAHFQMYPGDLSFSGNLPEELEDGFYNVKIAAKQTGCKGWSPIKGLVLNGTYLKEYDIDLRFDFVILGGKLYKVETDGLTEMKNGGMKSDRSTDVIYDLSGRKVNVHCKPGIYIIDGKKVVK